MISVVNDRESHQSETKRLRRIAIAERLVRSRLARSEIRIDSSSESAIRVHDARFYRRVIADGTLGPGEGLAQLRRGL